MRKIGPARHLVNLLTTARFVVNGDSMRPNFSPGHYILVSRLAYWLNEPSRGDVVVLQHPYQQHRTYIKRIVGLPGEIVRIRGWSTFIDGQLLEEPYLDQSSVVLLDDKEEPHNTFDEWTLGDEEYFLLGDNRASSVDSRSFGPLKRGLLIGKAWIRYWPRSAWGVVSR